MAGAPTPGACGCQRFSVLLTSASMKIMRKKITGTIISDKMKKTVVAQNEILRKHPAYGKYLKHRAKYYAHDEKGLAKVGDKILLEETRPLSKLKRWRVVKVLESKTKE